MILHFIRVITTQDTVKVSFDNGITWNEYPVLNDGTNVDDISFSKKDCSDLANILIGSTAKHTPYASDGMKKYFDLESTDTIYTTPESFKTTLATLENNTASSPYSIKIKGLTASNAEKIEQAYKETGKKVYVNINSSDFRFNNDLFNRGYFMGKDYQKYLVNITLPSDLTYIGSNTFNGCTNLKTVEIPTMVTDIGRKAFYGCTSLTSVTLPPSVTFIDDDAFGTEIERPDGSINVYYLGSITRWNRVEIESSNKYLLKDGNVTVITNQITMAELNNLLNTSTSSVDDPIPLSISDFDTNGSLEALNTAIRNTKQYVDLAGLDFSPYASKFEGMDSDDSSSLFDTDVKQYIVALSVPSNVTKIGQYVFSGYENLNCIVISDSVTEIGEGAFINCSNLAETTISSYIETIGYNAFYGCTNIKLSCKYSNKFSTFFDNTGVTRDNVYKIEIPNTLTSIDDYEFQNCTNLAGITLSDNITNIGKGAFKGCSRLRSIEIPSGITTIKEETFADCLALRTVKLPKGIKEIKDNAFYNDICLETIKWTGEDDFTASSNLESIGVAAFYKTNFSEIDLSKTSITNVPELCFSENTSISSIKLPSGLLSLDNKCLYNCSSLIVLSIPNSVETICDYVFYGTKISSITFPTSLKSIGVGAFKNSSLTSVTFPEGLTNIGEECFMNSAISSIGFSSTIKYIDAYAFCGCTNLTRLDLPVALEEIGYYSFEGCTNLKDVSIPDTVTGTKPIYCIDSSAFNGLTVPTVITMPTEINATASGEGTNGKKKDIAYIPSSMTDVEDKGFKIFNNIKTLYLPDGLETIGQDAFNSCTALENIYIPKSVTKIGFYAFNGSPNIKNIYYGGTEADWKALTVGWYAVPATASNGTQLKDGSSEDLTTYGTKLYVLKGNDNLFTEGIVVTYNATNSSHITDFTTNSLDGYSFTRSKRYGDYTFLVDDNNKAIKITSFGSIDNTHTLDTTVYSFGKGAFLNCPNLSLTIKYTDQISNYFQDSGITTSTELKITVPSTITELPNSIFKGYTGLIELNFEQPSQLTTIGSYALYGCKNLASLSVPESVTSIGEHAFQDCYGLKSITMNETTREIKVSTFEGCKNLVSINYPQELTTIEDRAFYGCESLVYVTFYEALTSIGTNAFANCGSLKVTCFYNEDYSDGTSEWRENSKYVGKTGISTKNIYHLIVDDSITSIPDSEFINEHNPLSGEADQYTNLYWIEIPATCTKIGSMAFAECDSLKKVEFKGTSTLKSIGEYAFENCTSLDTFDFPSSLKEIGLEAFSGCTALKEISLPENTLTLGEGIFSGCSSLTKAHLPSGLTYIPSNMFTADVLLADVNTPSGITVLGESCFWACYALKSFEIRSNVTSVGKDAFSLCNDIKLTIHYNSNWDYIYSQGGFSQSQVHYIHVDNVSTEIPRYKFENFTSVEEVIFDDEGTSVVGSIGVGAFRGCTNLTTLVPPESCTKIEDWAFAETSIKKFTFPSKVTRISNGLLQDCTNLTSVTFKNNPTELGEYTFKNCSSLSSITLPNTIKTLGKGSFWNCVSLTSINIPTSSTRVEDSLFYGCSKLNSIKLHSKVSELGNGAFTGCSSLTSFSSDGTTITEVDNSCFENCTALVTVKLSKITELGSKVFAGCSSLTNVTIPNSLSEIRFGTFENCASLATFTIPSSVTSIEGNVFTGCSSLTISKGSNSKFNVIWDGKGIISVDGLSLYTCIDYSSKSITVPSTVTKVGNGTFKNCMKLTSIEFPSSVQYIDEYSCQNCSSLTTVKLTKNVKRIGTGAFEGCENIGAVNGTGIFFTGTETEWANTTISPDGNTYITNPMRLTYC